MGLNLQATNAQTHSQEETSARGKEGNKRRDERDGKGDRERRRHEHSKAIAVAGAGFRAQREREESLKRVY